MTAEKPRTVSVVLFKESGKYYTEASWRAPEGAIGPVDMRRSPDFTRIGGEGKVLVTAEPHDHAPEDENWGFPQLL